MKKTLSVNLEKLREDHPMYVKATYGSIEGFFVIPHGNKNLRVISGCGEGWDHVSVSLPHRCPTWDEMCFIKNLFFEENETVVQIHPLKSKYINKHKFCLHLWKKWDSEIELPPDWMIA